MPATERGVVRSMAPVMPGASGHATSLSALASRGGRPASSPNSVRCSTGKGTNESEFKTAAAAEVLRRVKEIRAREAVLSQTKAGGGKMRQEEQATARSPGTVTQRAAAHCVAQAASAGQTHAGTLRA